MHRQLGGRVLTTMAMGLVVCSGCATAGVVATHPDFKTRRAHIHTMAVLPSKVEVYKLTFKGDREMMYDLLPPIAQWANQEIQTTFITRGYEMRSLRLTDEAFANHPELKQSLSTIQDIFNKRLEEYHHRWFPAFRAFTYSIGSEVNVFADHTDSDALVLMQCTGIKKTGGEITKDLAQSLLIAAATLGSVLVIQYPSITVIQMAVVDGNTGDILWYADNTQDAAFDIANETHFRKTLRHMVSQFPKAILPSLKAGTLPSTQPVRLKPVTPVTAVP